MWRRGLGNKQSKGLLSYTLQHRRSADQLVDCMSQWCTACFPNVDMVVNRKIKADYTARSMVCRAPQQLQLLHAIIA
jgi:hypothetical protein